MAIIVTLSSNMAKRLFQYDPRLRGNRGNNKYAEVFNALVAVRGISQCYCTKSPADQVDTLSAIPLADPCTMSGSSFLCVA